MAIKSVVPLLFLMILASIASRAVASQAGILAGTYTGSGSIAVEEDDGGRVITNFYTNVTVHVSPAGRISGVADVTRRQIVLSSASDTYETATISRHLAVVKHRKGYDVANANLIFRSGVLGGYYVRGIFRVSTRTGRGKFEGLDFALTKVVGKNRSAGN